MSDQDNGFRAATEAEMTQAQQEQKMMERAARLSAIPSYFAPVVMLFVTPSGNVRMGFGDQLHPQLEPDFYVSVTIQLENARGLRDQLNKLVEAMDMQIKAMQQNPMMAEAKPN